MAKLLFILLAALPLFGTARAVWAASTSATALGARYTSLEPALRHTPFNRPLVLDSTETPDRINGEIHAVIEQPFAATVAGLNDPSHWCDLLLLHMNTKFCQAKNRPAGTVLPGLE